MGVGAGGDINAVAAADTEAAAETRGVVDAAAHGVAGNVSVGTTASGSDIASAGTLDRHLYRFARDRVSFRLYHAWDKEDLYNQTSNSTLYIYFAMPRVGRAFQLIGTSSNPWFYGNTKPWTLCAQACGATDAATRPSA